MNTRSSRGFTLVELMIVVAIIGVLAAIAIPAFTRYVRRSRTTEAIAQLNKMWAGSVTYYMTDFTDSSGGQVTALPKQFPGPAAALEQTSYCCQLAGSRCPGGSSVWATDSVWLALKFALADPHTYMPAYTGGSGTGTAAQFTAQAFGSQGCVHVATFTRQGYVTTQGDVSGQTQPTVVNELE